MLKEPLSSPDHRLIKKETARYTGSPAIMRSVTFAYLEKRASMKLSLHLIICLFTIASEANFSYCWKTFLSTRPTPFSSNSSHQYQHYGYSITDNMFNFLRSHFSRQKHIYTFSLSLAVVFFIIFLVDLRSHSARSVIRTIGLSPERSKHAERSWSKPKIAPMLKSVPLSMPRHKMNSLNTWKPHNVRSLRNRHLHP